MRLPEFAGTRFNFRLRQFDLPEALAWGDVL